MTINEIVQLVVALSTLAVSLSGSLVVLDRLHAMRRERAEHEDNQDKRILRLEERPCCVRASGALPALVVEPRRRR